MKSIQRCVTYIITVVMLFQLLPAAFAVNNARVLTHLGHTDTNTVSVGAAGSEITLTVPYGFSGTQVDLTTGLDPRYNTSQYKNVVATPAGPAEVDGEAVALTVTYNHISESNDAKKSTTKYTIRVIEADAVPPEFSGVIKAERLGAGEIELAAAIFEQYEANDGEELGSVVISGSNPKFGMLKYNGAKYVFKSRIAAGSLDSLKFTATKTGTVSYNISAYKQGDTKTPVGSAVLTITVASTGTSVINKSINEGITYSFTAADFTQSSKILGIQLESVDITPTNTGFGTWYKGSTEFTAEESFTLSEIQSLSFKGTALGDATFDWRANTAVGSVEGSGVIHIESPEITLYPYTGTGMLKGKPWAVSPSHFDYAPDSVPLSMIKITKLPSGSDGYLYLTTALPKDDDAGYPAIAADKALTTGAVIPYSYFDNLRLSAKSTSKAEYISFSWTATTNGNAKSATWAEATTYTVTFASVGALSYETDMNAPLKLNASDLSEQFNSVTGLSLSYMTFTLPDKATGSLYLDFNLSTLKGTKVNASTKYYADKTPNLSNLTFVPAEDFTGHAVLSYTAYSKNGEVVSGTIDITVRSYPGGTLSCTTDKNSAILLDSADFQTAFFSATGQKLSYIRFSLPSSTRGDLFYNYTSETEYEYEVRSSSTYYVHEAPYLSYLSFVPAEDFTGTVSISYTGYSDHSYGYSGKLIIHVVDSPAGIVIYNVRQNGLVTLNGDDFTNEFIGVTGSVLSYITITPPKAEYGSLFYQYSEETKSGKKITAATKYYNGRNPDISELTFVPAEDYTGTVVVTFKAFTAAGASYEGKLKFNVGARASGTISYTMQRGQELTLNTYDFTSAFYDNSEGLSLSYVTFSQPSASYGKLYYKYTSSTAYESIVSSDTKYYVNATPYLSSVSFVPQASFTGSFTITYTGYASDGTSHTGKLKITVTGDDDGTVRYETSMLSPVRFRGYDFSNAFYDDTGDELSSVRFTPPHSSYGTLYYEYNSPTSYNSIVTSYTNYYINTNPLISDITFVPNPGFTGELTISYTGYDTYGRTSTGVVIINVTSSEVDSVYLSTGKNTPVSLNSEDLNQAFTEKTGSSLYSAVFSLPGSTYGILYYRYTSASSYSSLVSASAKYYRTVSPLISDITFVPASGFTGTVTIPYTGYTAGGTAYMGKIVITVNETSVNPFKDMENYSWATDAVTYLYEAGIIEGSGNGKFHPADSMSRGDFTLMIARAFGLSYEGTGNFADVPPESYYYDAIGAAKELGIVTGSGDQFDPNASLTRQDAMVIIYRALDASGVPLAAGSPSDLSDYQDAGNVAGYAAEAVAALVNAGVIAGSGGRLHPRDMISRAEMAVILYRILTM
jgi:hypothetical protein